MSNEIDKWLWIPKKNPQARVIIFCFHQAGGTAQSFRLWADEFGDIAEIRAIQLPGHADRMKEPLVRRISELTKLLSGILFSDPLNLPFAFFGHSLGALIAYDLALRLEARSKIANSQIPIAMGIASRSAPHIKFHSDPIFNLGDEVFLEAMTQRYGASPGQEAMKDPEIRELYLPMIKADMELFDTYEFKSAPPLNIPIFAGYGEQDPAMNDANMRAWSSVTSNKFVLQKFGGDHFFWMKEARIITEPFKQFMIPFLA